MGAQKPARVLVHFVDDVFEGQGRVGAARPAEGFRGRISARSEIVKSAWSLIEQAGLDEDDPRVDAAEQIFKLLFDNEEVSVWYNRGGALRVTVPEGLAAQLSLTTEQLTGHPLAFTENGHGRTVGSHRDGGKGSRSSERFAGLG